MHHILEKNRRVFSSKQKKVSDSSSSMDSQNFSQSSKSRSKEQQGKFLSTISNEGRELLKSVQQIQKDLKMRQENFGDHAPTTVECLQHFVKTCNDNALHMLKKGEFRVATEFLHQCEYLLMSPLGQNYPLFKYQTLNNLAHAHNVQANVRLSLKYLLRSLDYAMQVDGIEGPQKVKGKQTISLAETYLNICNAYSFLNQSEQALEFAERAIVLSHNLISQIMQILDNEAQMLPDDRDFLGEQYHQQVNLLSMSFHTKGQIFEKMKKFDEAIGEYQSGKEIIERNYGSQHKVYMDFVNAINGAKLRIKYLQHSNLPKDNSEYAESENAPYDSEVIPAKRTFIVDRRQSRDLGQFQRNQDKSLFMQEMERMKPMNQKRLRPGSAKQEMHSQDFKYPQSRQNPANRSHFDIAKLGGQGPSLSQMKNRSIKRTHLPPKQNKAIFSKNISSPSSNKSTSSSNNNERLQFSSHRRQLKQKIINFQESDHSKSRHHHQECESCQDQIQEIKNLQQESNKLMNLLFQQQQSSTQGNNNSIPALNVPQLNASQSQQFMKTNQTNTQQMGQSMPTFQPYQQQQPQQFYPMNPQPYLGYGYPNQMSPYFYPMMPPYMYPPPGAGMYPYPPESYQYQMPMNPQFNNFMGTGSSSRLGGETDKKISPFPNHHQAGYVPHQYQWDQFRQQMMGQEQNHQDPKQKTPEQSHGRNDQNQINFHPRAAQLSSQEKDNHFQSSYTDINERDSRFGDFFDNELRETHKQASDVKLRNNDLQKHVEIPIPDISKSRFEFQGSPPIIYKMKEVKLQNLAPMIKAATFIQNFFRRFKCKRHFELLKNRKFEKIKFHKAFYTLREANLRPQTVLLIVTLVLEYHRKEKDQGSKLIIKPKPKCIVIELYNHLAHKVVYKSEFEISHLGMEEKKPKKHDIINYVKGMMTTQQFTGNPQVDFVFEDENSQGHQSEQDEDREDDLVDEGFDKEKEDSFATDSKSGGISSPEKQFSRKSSNSSNRSKNSVSQIAAPQPVVQPAIIGRQQTKIELKSKPQQESNKKIQKSPIDSEIDEEFERQSIKDDYNDDEDEDQSLEKGRDIYNSVQQQLIAPSQTLNKNLLDKKQAQNPKPLTKSEAALRIQKKFRQNQAKDKVMLLKLKEKKLKGKNSICQFLVSEGANKAQVTLKKQSKNHKLNKVGQIEYKIEVKNLSKNFKKNKLKQKIDEIPVAEQFMRKNLESNLKIIWNGEQIKEIKYNQNDQSIANLSMTTNIHRKLTSPRQQPPPVVEASEAVLIEENQNKVYSVAELLALDQDKDAQDQKNKGDLALARSERDKKRQEREQKIIKSQALIRGHLTRMHFRPAIENENDFIMIHKMARRLGNNKLYHIFLLRRTDKENFEDQQEPYYIVTLREVQNINELYDLEISLAMAKKIFGRKNSTDEEVQKLIMYETNKLEFTMMLQCLDIINDEFSLDFKKFRMMQFETNKLDLFDNHSQPPQVASILDRNVIPEAESRFEQSPDITHQSKKASDLSSNKPLINLKQQEAPQPSTGATFVPPKKKKLKRVDYKLLALIRIQAAARRYLTAKRLEAKNIYSFWNKSEDPAKHLKLTKQGAFKACGMFFKCYLYTDSSEEFVKVTLRTVQPNQTVISLKKIMIAENEIDIADVPDYLQEVIEEHGEQILYDDKSGELRKDWLPQLNKYLQESL